MFVELSFCVIILEVYVIFEKKDKSIVEVLIMKILFLNGKVDLIVFFVFVYCFMVIVE